MSMSPAEVRHVRMKRGLFGYRAKDVNGTLDRVAEAFGDVWRQRAEMEERNHQLAIELARHQEAEQMLRKTLVTAERSADVLRGDARRDAERIVREAEQRAREIVGEAHHERERVRHEIIRLEEREREFRARFRAMITATSSVVDQYEHDTGEHAPVAPPVHAAIPIPAPSPAPAAPAPTASSAPTAIIRPSFAPPAADTDGPTAHASGE
jgi:cell division initiation protein